MTGMRVTWRRKWPRIFEEHPIPWSFTPRNGAQGMCVYDANGQLVANTAATVYVYALRVLYEYAVPLFGTTDYGARRDESQRIPALLADYPTPWSFLEIGCRGTCTLDYLRRQNDRGRFTAFMLESTVLTYRTAAAHFYIVEAIFELSELADDKYNRTTRGLW